MSAQEVGSRIERLTAAVEGLPDPYARRLAEELSVAVVEMHGQGLAALLAGLDPNVVRRASDDELVSSLLLLHGLHPVPLEERVLKVLDGDDAELVGVTDGVATVRLTGCLTGTVVERALLDAVPDLIAVAIEPSAPVVGIALPMSANGTAP